MTFGEYLHHAPTYDLEAERDAGHAFEKTGGDMEEAQIKRADG